jgi:hypothetical protein
MLIGMHMHEARGKGRMRLPHANTDLLTPTFEPRHRAGPFGLTRRRLGSSEAANPKPRQHPEIRNTAHGFFTSRKARWHDTQAIVIRMYE